MEEERRLCYVGMTRAETKLYLSWARYRRRFGGGQPEPSVRSRFLKEVPATLLETVRGDSGHIDLYAERSMVRETASRNLYTGKTYNSVDSIRQFFGGQSPGATRGAAGSAPAAKAVPPQASLQPQVVVKPAVKKVGPGSTVQHAKYGRGTIMRIEGTGDDAKVSVSFPGHGVKKLVAKYAGIKV
jgi:DNA helicase-2/ATP-dependent DNA helicase PcrA